jgi:spermidine synthase
MRPEQTSPPATARFIDGAVSSARELAGRTPLLLMALVAGSGCAALIYQVVWFQLLSLVIGASAVSLGVLLGTFMGGMCIGSLLLSRWVSPAHLPLRVYALIEVAIAAFAVLVLYAMPAIGRLYFAWGGSGASGMMLRAVVAAVCLLPPTMLMGATLPAIARALASRPRRAPPLGWLYAANIAGAVVGSVLAGFYLLRAHDVTAATFAAVALNVTVAAASFAFARRVREAAADDRSLDAPAARSAASVPTRPAVPSAPWPVYAAIALSGMTALAAEVLWTRNLSLLLGGTVYTFALIVAVFLLGLGIGSGAGAAVARRLSGQSALGYCQLLLCVGIAWGAYALAESLPYWPLDVTLPMRPWVALQLDLLRTAYAILPAAILWGASFPFALTAAAAPGQDPGRLMGRLYAANTAGAVIGALATSFVLVVWLGSERTQQLMIVICACTALLLLVPTWTHVPRARAAAAIGAVIVGAAALAYGVPRLPAELVAYGRFMPTRATGAEILYVNEGLTASVAVSRQENGTLTYHNAGKAQASSYPQDMRLQRMLGHLTTLVPERSESFLVIGLGAGITAGAVSIDPGVQRVVVAEIEPLVPRVAAEYFAAQNFGVVADPKVEILIDDGRHYLATTKQTFDGITSDPLDPWVKGAAALYTREFWRLAKARLNPGGVVTVFLQLYESTDDAVKSEVATFFEVFPNGAVFANTVRGAGYDAVLLGRAGDEPIDVDRVHARLRDPGYDRVARSLGQIGFGSAADLLGTYAAGAAELADWLAGAQINTDRNLRLQYLAGRGLNESRADEILNGMLTAAGSGAPEDLFTGSEDLLRQLRQAIRARTPRRHDNAFE